MNKKLEGPFKELPYKKILDALVSTSKTQGTDIKELKYLKKKMVVQFGKVQTQAFFDSLPKSAYPMDKNAATAKFYALPISASEQMLNSGNKTKLTGNNKGGLVDYRKKGMFK